MSVRDSASIVIVLVRIVTQEKVQLTYGNLAVAEVWLALLFLLMGI